MRIIPNSKPIRSESQIRAVLLAKGITSPLAILAVRGYYGNLFGKPGNDRGVYDDAMFVVGPQAFASFNASTDPSIFRAGMASLVAGIHWYRKGLHGLSWKWPRVPYPALRPATPGEQVPVTRDGQTNPRPGTAINIHKGGNSNTFSEGCQTLPPTQYDAFLALVYSEMDRSKLTIIPYVLIDNEELEKLTRGTPTAADVLETTLRKQMTRDKSLVQMLIDGANKYQLPVAFVLAIASRETGIVNMAGDGGHGRGVMQIDDRYHDVAKITDFYKNPDVLITYGCKLLAAHLVWARKNWPQYTLKQHLKIAAAAYNSGQGGAKKGIVSGDADAFTTHRNYGADILKRMEIFEKLIAEAAKS